MTDLGPCDEAEGFRDPAGYVQVWDVERKRMTLAHRLAWEQAYGRLPDRYTVVMHKCDNPPCKRLDHLVAGTQKQNREDCANKGRTAKGYKNGVTRRLSDDAVRAIRSLDGVMPQIEIGALFGIGQVAVHCVIRRRTYAHVPD